MKVTTKKLISRCSYIFLARDVLLLAKSLQFHQGSIGLQTITILQQCCENHYISACSSYIRWQEAVAFPPYPKTDFRKYRNASRRIIPSVGRFIGQPRSSCKIISKERQKKHYILLIVGSTTALSLVSARCKYVCVRHCIDRVVMNCFENIYPSARYCKLVHSCQQRVKMYTGANKFAFRYYCRRVTPR